MNEAKRYLSRIIYLKNDIQRARNQLRQIEAQAVSIGSIRYDKDNVQTSPMNFQEDAVIRLVEAQERLSNVLASYHEQYIAITCQIDSLDDALQREVLKQYYADGHSIKQIADRLHYTRQWVYEVFNEGIKAFYEMHLNNLN